MPVLVAAMPHNTTGLGPHVRLLHALLCACIRNVCRRLRCGRTVLHETVRLTRHRSLAVFVMCASLSLHQLHLSE